MKGPPSRLGPKVPDVLNVLRTHVRVGSIVLGPGEAESLRRSLVRVHLATPFGAISTSRHLTRSMGSPVIVAPAWRPVLGLRVSCKWASTPPSIAKGRLRVVMAIDRRGESLGLTAGQYGRV
jgi:hypothetical protein